MIWVGEGRLKRRGVFVDGVGMSATWLSVRGISLFEISMVVLWVWVLRKVGWSSGKNEEASA